VKAILPSGGRPVQLLVVFVSQNVVVVSRRDLVGIAQVAGITIDAAGRDTATSRGSRGRAVIDRVMRQHGKLAAAEQDLAAINGATSLVRQLTDDDAVDTCDTSTDDIGDGIPRQVAVAQTARLPR